jgi:hypothetical protein
MFELTSNKSASRDEGGKVRHIEHIREPFLSPSLAEPTPEQLADQYLAEVAPTYQLDVELLADLSAAVPEAPTHAEAQLHRDSVKDIAGSIVVDYVQTYRGLPVWRADFSVHIASNPMRVTSSTSTLHDAITLGNDPKAAAADYQTKLTTGALKKMLGIKRGKGVSKINGIRLVIYQYDPDQRTEPGARPQEEKRVSFEEVAPTLPLPPLPKTIKAGTHYAVAEVLFDLDIPEWRGLHWLALVEPQSESVLYLRALVSGATGRIFRMDPISLSGDSTLIPAAPEASLNALRTSETLTDLIAGTPQDLRGSRVDLQEIENPVMADPTTATPFAFDYNTKTTNFAAVNAYYHVNWFFKLIEGMGFSLNTYFDHTTFPVPVDHWSLGAPNNVNAHCPGNATSNGIGHFCFAAAQSGQTVGIADDVRVVIHEFGHALLWDHVNSPNFGFAHSAGDSLAAILMDPNSVAPDRFLTFPWPQSGGGPLDRRHDRKISDGWGWFGSRYNTQYNGEQVLSTTLFRLYQAVGGDSPFPPDRAWASRYVSYLIIKAIGTLNTTTNDPRIFATALMNADLTTANFEGHPGGALHKVIRWAFEKQGLYQANAVPGTSTPVTQQGNPPDVDVYIDDGRHGEYPYLFAFWESQDMWVRRSPDGGTTHQNPAVGKPNYMYVRVKNRGTQTANNVVVKAYHCNPGSGLAWPSHWSPMDTPQLAAPGPIPAGGQVVVGPFKWTPEVYGHECLLAIASATGDLGNDTTVFGSIPHSRFVPFDNNIGQRNVHPIFVINWKKILEYVKRLPFHVVNPFKKAVKVELLPILPKLLTDEKYWLFFNNPGGNKFEIGPFETKKVAFSMVRESRIPSRRPWEPLPIRPKPGIPKPEDMLDKDVPNSLEEFASGKPIKFRIVTLIDGQNMGGMTYILEPGEGRLPIDVSGVSYEEKEERDINSIRETLESQPGVKRVRVRNMTVDIEFEE